MKEIKKFISNFIENEYLCNKNEYLTSVTDDNYERLKKEAIKYYHSYISTNLFIRGISKENIKYFTAEQVKSFEKNSLDAIPRTLFQIKHYKDFTLGDSLKRIVTSKDLFACYVSYPSKGPRDLYFSSIFFVAESNEGLKIIYRMSFDSDKGKWYHPVDLDVLRVNNNGTLMAMEKYQAPEEATSLADYNAN